MKRAAGAVLCLVLGTSVARAEDDQALSAGIGFATFSLPGEPTGDMEPTTVSPGGGEALAVSYERAIGLDVSLRAELAGALFHGGNDEDQSSVSYAALGDLGVTFRFDVVRWVPYAFAGLGGVASGGGPIAAAAGGLDFVVVVGGGVDYLVSRARSLGLEARLASFGGDITVFTVGVRGTLRWGFF
ncbi:MAG: hypothetical protein WKG01_36285 [Kofleriaceae bacterium]